MYYLFIYHCIRLITKNIEVDSFYNINYIYRSIFGENALANLSIEKPVDDPDSKVTGHIRVRAKSQVNVVANIGLFPHSVLY